MNYESKTSEQIKQIALDYMAGQLFCSDQVQNINDMPMVFMILLFLPEEDLKDLREGKITFVYEYMDQASPRSINGMPMFYSAKFLDHEDRKRMYAMVEKLRAAVSEVEEEEMNCGSNGSNCERKGSSTRSP